MHPYLCLTRLCYNKVFTSSPRDPRRLNNGVGQFYASFKTNSMLGPEPQILWDLGGLNVDRIRNNGEAFRLFWAMWMHSGWIHIGFNVLSQFQYFFMFEPDWGFWKCLTLFFIAGISGNPPFFFESSSILARESRLWGCQSMLYDGGVLWRPFRFDGRNDSLLHR